MPANFRPIVVDSVPGRIRSRRTWLELFRPPNPYLDLCRTLKKSQVESGRRGFYDIQDPGVFLTALSCTQIPIIVRYTACQRARLRDTVSQSVLHVKTVSANINIMYFAGIFA